MKQSNTKILTKKELEIVNSKYDITYYNELLFVKTKTINRVVCHSLKDSFTIVVKIGDKVRNIKISSTATKMYAKNYLGTNYSLFDIQNAINALVISYKDVNKENIDDMLNLIK